MSTDQSPDTPRLGVSLWVVNEGGHDVPRPKLIGESLAWLDKYLGAVK